MLKIFLSSHRLPHHSPLFWILPSRRSYAPHLPSTASTCCPIAQWWHHPDFHTHRHHHHHFAANGTSSDPQRQQIEEKKPLYNSRQLWTNGKKVISKGSNELNWILLLWSLCNEENLRHPIDAVKQTKREKNRFFICLNYQSRRKTHSSGTGNGGGAGNEKEGGMRHYELMAMKQKWGIRESE